MKNPIILYALLFFGFISCSKDTLDPIIANQNFIERSEIIITVTHSTWSDLQSDLNCSGTGTQIVSHVDHAKVDLYPLDLSLNDNPSTKIKYGVTDQAGKYVFTDLDPGTYMIIVDTPYGQKTKTVQTQLHKRTTVDFLY